MKKLFITQILFLLICLTPAKGTAQAALEPSLSEKKEVVSQSGIATEDGPRTFVGNEGLFTAEGANFKKIFGPRKPSTLWSHNRRVKSYENAIRVAVQLPTIDPHAIALERWQNILGATSLGSGPAKEAAEALNSLKTGYIKEYDKFDKLRNDLAQFLRKVSPRTRHGAPVRITNLKKLSIALEALDWMSTCGNFAIGAALEHALATDAALDRLDEIRHLLNCSKARGNLLDDAWFEALDRAESNLNRSENYYGALIITLDDHKKEIAKKGVATAYPRIIKKVFHAKMAHHVGLFLKHRHPAWTAAHIKSVAGGAAILWTWSILATYYTIAGLLDQHENAQVSVASATLDDLMHQVVSGGGISLQTEQIILQGQITYFHKMEKATSGLLPYFHDTLSALFLREKGYKNARDYFKSKKEELEGRLLSSAKSSPQGPQATGPTPGGRSILIILDTSGSMDSALPGAQGKKLDGAKKAVLRMIDTTSGPAEWALIAFHDCRPRIIVDFTEDTSRIRDILSKLRATGSTPIAASLRLAGEYLQHNGRYITCDVVLLSDGQETCKGDPVKEARDLYGQSIDFTEWMKP